MSVRFYPGRIVDDPWAAGDNFELDQAGEMIANPMPSNPGGLNLSLLEGRIFDVSGYGADDFFPYTEASLDRPQNAGWARLNLGRIEEPEDWTGNDFESLAPEGLTELTPEHATAAMSLQPARFLLSGEADDQSAVLEPIA